MGLLRMAALGALGYAGWKYFERSSRQSEHEAYAPGQAGERNFSAVRDSGPSAMADAPRRDWTRTDEEVDESFPASDPPANY